MQIHHDAYAHDRQYMIRYRSTNLWSVHQANSMITASARSGSSEKHPPANGTRIVILEKPGLKALSMKDMLTGQRMYDICFVHSFEAYCTIITNIISVSVCLNRVTSNHNNSQELNAKNGPTRCYFPNPYLITDSVHDKQWRYTTNHNA